MTSRPIALSLIAAITLFTWGQSALTRNATVDPCDLPENLQSLSGTYAAENIGINKLGKHVGSSTLTITVDSDGIINGSRSWSSSSHQGHKKDGELANSDTEVLIGVIHPQTCEIGLAEFGETGSYYGRYRPDGAIELLLIQSGEAPVVIRNTYRRQTTKTD